MKKVEGSPQWRS